MEGEYDFTLQFRLEKEGEEDYIVRSSTTYMMSRSVNTDITLDAGRYSILVKVTAYRRKGTTSPETVVEQHASCRREKLVQIGLSYDLAHTKGLEVETEEEKTQREEREERHRFTERTKLREQTIKKLQQQHIREKKIMARKDRMMVRDRLRQAAAANYHAEPLDEEDDSSHDDMKTPNGNGNGYSYVNGNGNSISQSTRKARVPSRPPRPSLNMSFSRHGHRDVAELLEDFEFDSDIDMPPDESPRASKPPSLSTESTFGQGGEDPWNAVCVVGLKVFSKDPQLKLQVVKPEGGNGEAPLDRDDPAVSATLEKRSSWFTGDWNR